MESLPVKKGDKWIFLGVGIFVILSFIGFKLYEIKNKGAGQKAIIKQNNKIVDIVDLSNTKESRFWEIKGSHGEYNKIEMRNNQIHFIEANCPDQVCVHTGWIQDAGTIAVCLPNRVSIEITRDETMTVDDVAY